MQEQVEAGTLKIRKMTAKERKASRLASALSAVARRR